MSQTSKGKKEPVITNLDNFEFDPAGLDIRWSKNIISVLDGYRIHRCYDITFIEKAIGRGDLPKSFTKQWGTIRPVLHKFAAVGPNVPLVESYMKRRQSIQLLSLVMMTVALPLVAFAWIFRVQDLTWLTTPFTFLTLGILMVAFLASGWYNRKVAWAIYHHIEENGAKFENDRRHLKKWVQTTVFYTSRLLRKEEKMKPKKRQVKFWNNDYEGVKLVKEPNWFRKNYVLELNA